MIKRADSAIQSWELLATNCSFTASPWVGVYRDTVRLPSGRIVEDYYRIQLPEYVMIYAQRDDRKVLLQQQYKHALGAVSLSLPTGCLENTELPLEAGKREFLEETGYIAHQWRFLGRFLVDGNKGCGRVHFYIAQQLEKRAEPVEDDMEETEIVFMEPKALIHAIGNGEIPLLATAALVSIATHPFLGKVKK